jgi:hypothetical protein
MEQLSQPRELRRRFLLHLIGQASNPSSGYVHLATLLHRRIVRTVLTTNFDDLLKIAYGPGALMVIGKPDEYPVVSTAPPYPQVVYLHGQAEYYMDRTLRAEIDHLDPALIDRLLPLVRDHPVVVVGYRGAEPSVMRDLFLNNVAKTTGFTYGIHWCVRVSNGMEAGVHPFVRELAERCGPNFAVVPIVDFDTFVGELSCLWDMALQTGPQPGNYGAPQGYGSDARILPFDLRPAPFGVEKLNWAEVAQRLQAYATRLDQSPPADLSHQWCEQQLLQDGLAAKNGAALCMTNAGVLLLSAEPRSIAPGAYVELRLPDRPPRALDGNLWEQKEAVLAILQEANRAVRIKGSRSQTLRPYPEEALKEVIANALIHRDYEVSDPIVVKVSQDSITVESPGGLEEHLLHRLLAADGDGSGISPIPRDLLQRRIVLGQRGDALKGYRNTVLADLFFGAGIVDKAGSGLADALEAMEAVGGRLVTAIAPGNETFTVTLFRRPSQVDASTGTARPAQPSVYLHANLFEVLEVPAVVWSASSALRRRPDLSEDPDAKRLPPFVSYDGRVFTFADLTEPANPLRSYVNTVDMNSEATSTFESNKDRLRWLIHLLHEVLFAHLHQLGLKTDWNNKRAYYACTRGSARYVQYRPQRYRKEKRRVAWWPGQERSYCVHKAAIFHFERYGGRWVLRISPTYVFTVDGGKDRIIGPEAASLATRHSTEDYNSKVRADVFFWRSVLGDGRERIFIDAGDLNRIVLSAEPVGGLLTPLISSMDSRASVREPAHDSQ